LRPILQGVHRFRTFEVTHAVQSHGPAAQASVSLGFFQSTLGKKSVVAVTGAVLLGFLVGHVAGNLKIFLPDPEPGVSDIDVYAEFLRSMGEPMLPHGGALWTFRLILIVALVLHVVFVVQLSLVNRAVRPNRYERQHQVRGTFAAKWMMLSGVLVLGFVVFHLLHFTTGTIDPANFEHGRVYANVYAAFVRWPLVVLYAVAMGMVSLHLYHGAWSMFQTLGLDSPGRNRALRWFATIISVALFVGFVVVPISVAVGALDAPSESVGQTETGGE
jgi:succinate dehydrogenase / fumarate reductase cytochrome b subunit